MEVLCKYYSNNIRLVSELEYLSTNDNFKFYCLRGTVSVNKKQFRVLTSHATLFVSMISSETKRNLIAILTSDPNYKEYHLKSVDTDIIGHSNVSVMLCKMLRDKYLNTGNDFEVEFNVDKRTILVGVDVESKDAPFRCVIKTTEGDLITMGETALVNLLQNYKSLRAFSFRTITTDLEKELSVRKNRGEILREISHYLNRTLVMVSFVQDGKLLEQYINSRGALEVLTRENSTKVYKKVAPSAIRTTKPFCIYLTSSTPEDIAREHGKLLKSVK